jgi:hypothetical protein
MTPAEAKTLFPPFLAFAKTLEGDEKSEAQIFLDHLFRALGHEGVKEAGATFEYRVAVVVQFDLRKALGWLNLRVQA